MPSMAVPLPSVRSTGLSRPVPVRASRPPARAWPLRLPLSRYGAGHRMPRVVPGGQDHGGLHQYRQFPDKLALLTDALAHRARAVPDVPDTGILPGDMRAFLRRCPPATSRSGRWPR